MGPAVRAMGVLFAFTLAPLGSALAANDAAARVEAYLGPLRTLSAGFSQVVRNRDGDVVERATGTVAISRPDRFRWEYQAPHEQTIVADGRRLWLYDRDLEQVTVRTLEAGLGSTPAMLLSGGGRITDAFEAVAVEKAGDWTWCRLKPRQEGSDFDQVSLAFDARDELAAMELRDKLGQATVIEFGSVRRNPSLDDGLFRFEPPPGADVIGQAAP
jgi:outer membrane lipoprotein carrier protein